jgi:spermidine synthase
MKWFSESQHRASTKNGDVLVKRTLGMWEVFVKGCGQSTEYTNGMWKDAFKRISNPHETKPVLMLGLAAGGGIPLLHKQFPHCEITAVEYDPTMISLAQELGLYRPYPFPVVIEGDAAAVVPQLTNQFDLIIVDLFDGPAPSLLCKDSSFLATLQQRMAPRGSVLINVYKESGYLGAAKKTFSSAEIWKYRENTIGLFRHV